MAENTIDTLQIKIESESNNAERAIDNLVAAMLRLQKGAVGLQKINFDSAANGLAHLSESAKGLNAGKVTDYSAALKDLSESVKGFAGIEKSMGKAMKNLLNFSQIDLSRLNIHGDFNGLTNLAEGIKRLAESIPQMATLKAVDINRTSSALGKLSTIDFGPLAQNLQALNGVDMSKLTLFGQAIQGFSSMLAGSDKVPAATAKIFSSLSQLSATAANIPQITANLPELSAKISAFISSISAAPLVDSGTVSLVSSLSKLSTAGIKAEKTAASLPALSEGIKHFVESMAVLPKIDESTLRAAEAMAQLTNSLTKTGNASGRLKIDIDSLSGSMGVLKNGAVGAIGGIKVFSRQILAALGVSAGIYGVVRATKASISEFSNLIEIQNVVNKSFGEMAYKVEELAKISIPNFGMSELTLKQISSRYQAMGMAMGFAQDKMSDMSIELTKLAADMASFYNVNQKDVAKSLESIFTGTTRPLRTYGLDLTQVTLQEWALAQGMDVNIKKMSQAEKTLLRYQYVLANTKNISNDFLSTQSSWANQTRILGQQFQQLGSIIGGGFISALLPVVTTINTVIAKIIQLANTLSSLFGKLFGIKKAVSSAGAGLAGVADISGDIAESSEAAADGIAGTGGAAKKAQRELNKYVAAWHEVNNMTTNDNSGGSGGSGGGGASLPDMELPDKYDFTVKVEDEASPVIEAIRQKMDSLGRYFNTGLIIGFKDDGVLDSIRLNLENIKNGFANIFSDSDVLNAANTLMHVLAFNAGKKVGAFESIGATILDNITGGFSMYLGESEEKIKGYLIDMFNITGQTDTISSNLMMALADIFSVFRSDDAKTITRDFIQLFIDGFMGASELAAKFGRDILELVASPITNNAQKIKEALENTLSPLRTILDTLAASFTHLWQSVNEMYDNHISPMFKAFTQGITEITGSLLDGYNIYISPVLDKLGDKFSTVWESAVCPTIDNFIGMIGDAADTVTAFWNNVFQPFINWTAQKIMPVIAPVIEGMGKLFLDNFQTMGESINGFIDVSRDLLKFLTNTFEGDWQGAWENIKKAFNDIWGLLPDEITTPIENAAKGLTEFITVHAENFGAAWGVMKSKFETIWNLMPEAIKKPIEDASNGIVKFVLDISTGNWKTAWESMKNVFQGIWGKMPDAVKGPVNTIIGFANAMLSAIEGGVNGAISALNNLSINIPSTPFTDAFTLGFNFSKISLNRIPALEKGGIVNTATFALLGENGREAVIPLERNTDWMEDVAVRMSNQIINDIGYLKLNTDIPQPDFLPKSYNLGNFQGTMQMEMDAKMAALEFENRQLREAMEENTAILNQILDKGIVLDNNEFAKRYKSSAIDYRKRTGNQLGVAF